MIVMEEWRARHYVRRLCDDRHGKIARAMRDDERRAREYGCRVCPDTDYRAVLMRDLFPYCQRCGDLLVPATLSFDHVIPLSAGGDHCNANVRALCWPCNRAKGARLLPEVPLD